MTILIVDDDKLICENIKSKLLRLKHNKTLDIIFAHSTTEAEILYDKLLPDILLTDICMQGLSGLVLLEKVMQKEHLAKSFVISSYDDYSYVRKAFLLGAVDYLLKPIDIEELDKKISPLIIASSSNNSPTPPLDNTDLIKQALRYIEENLHHQITMKDVSQNVNVSYNYFSKLFKDSMQCSFSQYIHTKRIQEAKKYLKDPSIKILDIARKLGYDNPHNFSRTFKKYTGYYPSDFRDSDD